MNLLKGALAGALGGRGGLVAALDGAAGDQQSSD